MRPLRIALTLSLPFTIAAAGLAGTAAAVDRYEPCLFPPAGYTLIDGTVGNDTLTGTAANEVIRGFSGNDKLKGGGGIDILCGGGGGDLLSGGKGPDQLFGESGPDTFIGGSGKDRIDGGGEADIISYEWAPHEVTVELSNGFGWGQVDYQPRDTLLNIENVQGSRYPDHIDVAQSSPTKNLVFGGGGYDKLRGDKQDFLNGQTDKAFCSWPGNNAKPSMEHCDYKEGTIT